MKLHPTLFAVCAATLLFAQDNGGSLSIDDVDFDNAFKDIEKEFEEVSAEIDAEFEEMAKQIDQEHKAFSDFIDSKWGEGENNTNQQYVWVEYNDDYNSRTVVDYENETAEVEVLVSDAELKDSVAVRERITKAVTQMLESQGKSVEYESKVIPQTTVSEVPIMNGVVDLSHYNIAADKSRTTKLQTEEEKSEAEAKKRTDELLDKQIGAITVIAPPAPEPVEPTKPTPTPVATPKPVVVAKSKATSTEVKAIVDAIVAQEPLTVSRVNTSKGAMNIVKISPKLVGDFKYKKAQQFEPIVDKYAAKYNIDKSLIFGIIETESMFDATASSHIPAHGLMQIVPRSAGMDSYQFVYGQKKLVTQSYLYKPENNIELGVAYLHILKTRWFHKVTDPSCQELCMIAAYNTGMGNVGRAFTGHTKLYQAIPQINALNYNELYKYLTTRLHEKEARDYVVKVSSKRVKYRGQ